MKKRNTYLLLCTMFMIMAAFVSCEKDDNSPDNILKGKWYLVNGHYIYTTTALKDIDKGQSWDFAEDDYIEFRSKGKCLVVLSGEEFAGTYEVKNEQSPILILKIDKQADFYGAYDIIINDRGIELYNEYPSAEEYRKTVIQITQDPTKRSRIKAPADKREMTYKRMEFNGSTGLGINRSDIYITFGDRRHRFLGYANIEKKGTLRFDMMGSDPIIKSGTPAFARFPSWMHFSTNGQSFIIKDGADTVYILRPANDALIMIYHDAGENYPVESGIKLAQALMTINRAVPFNWK